MLLDDVVTFLLSECYDENPIYCDDHVKALGWCSKADKGARKYCRKTCQSCGRLKFLLRILTKFKIDWNEVVTYTFHPIFTQGCGLWNHPMCIVKIVYITRTLEPIRNAKSYVSSFPNALESAFTIAMVGVVHAMTSVLPTLQVGNSTASQVI